MGEHDLALAAYDRAAALGPDRPEIFTNRGLVHASRGDYDLALADHDRALAIDADDIAACYNRACALSLKHDPSTIAADLRQVFERQPDLRQRAADDPDLEWARRHVPELGGLLGGPHAFSQK